MKRNFQNLRRDPFDLLVIGGGIYGAWTAYDACRYGVEMDPEVPMTTQERAYTSPIWYTP